MEDAGDGALAAAPVAVASRGAGLYHAYNAVLKRAHGGKSRTEMTLVELEAALAWLSRNRLSNNLHLLEGDHRYGWAARKRGEWKPPTGKRASEWTGSLRRARPIGNETEQYSA